MALKTISASIFACKIYNTRKDVDMSSLKIRERAFTLAEVLITLVVIGVIAALTIPTLINKTNNEAYVTALKKFYSETNQVLQTLAAQDCGTPGSIVECFDTSKAFEQAVASHFKISKNCNYDKNQNCWAPVNINYDGSGSDFQDYDFNSINSLNFVTLDGMSVGIDVGPDCESDYSDGNDPESPLYNTCGIVEVDVNGLKPPNRSGVDVFKFWVTSNKTPLLYPRGG